MTLHTFLRLAAGGVGLVIGALSLAELGFSGISTRLAIGAIAGVVSVLALAPPDFRVRMLALMCGFAGLFGGVGIVRSFLMPLETTGSFPEISWDVYLAPLLLSLVYMAVYLVWHLWDRAARRSRDTDAPHM